MTPATEGRVDAPQNPRDDDAHGDAMPLAIVAAVAANGVIGAGNRLPWRLPEDLRHFRALTTGHAVIMGRKTWESLPGALSGRQNIVVSRDAGYRAPGAEVAASLDAALALVRMPPPAFCIGGGELYRQAIARARLLYLTEIDCAFDGDTTFPEFDRRAWPERNAEAHASSGPDGYAYRFVTRERRAP
jgi:dihydrofolate reductase